MLDSDFGQILCGKKKIASNAGGRIQADLAQPRFVSVLALLATNVAETRGASLFCPRASNLEKTQDIMLLAFGTGLASIEYPWNGLEA